MQFKRGGWQYPEADGVVTMPGNARQAFPAKRDGGGSGERRTGMVGVGDGERRQSYNTGRSGSLSHICLYAILYSRKRFARDITQSRFIQRNATQRDASRHGATQSSSGSVVVFNPGMLSACLRTMMKTLRITANICILRFHNIGKITTDECHPVS